MMELGAKLIDFAQLPQLSTDFLHRVHKTVTHMDTSMWYCGFDLALYSVTCLQINFCVTEYTYLQSTT